MLKINIFTFGKRYLSKNGGLLSLLALLYSILFMSELEEEIIKESEYKPYLQWKYLHDISFLWENKLKFFIDKINKVDPTIKFTAEWSKASVNCLDVTGFVI